MNFKTKNLEIEKNYVIKTTREIAKIYARLLNRSKSKKQTLFSARFYKLDGDVQTFEEVEFYFILNINQSLMEFDNDNFDIISQL